MDKKSSVIRIFSLNIRSVLGKLSEMKFEHLQEIRLRMNSPLIVVYKNKEYFINESGELTYDPKNSYIITNKEIKETIEYISNYSLYAFEEDIKQGFITIQGGHRVGLAGKVIMEAGKIKNIKYISFINVRISHEIKGCADEVVKAIVKDNSLYHTMIISPPRCGKTTLLRDIVRQISNGNLKRRGMTVGVVDERSEIGGCYNGIPQNDLGIRTDLLDCCPKADGMLMLIRSMSPEVVAVDEIGSEIDINAIEYVMNSGCKLICTVHGQSMEDMEQKPILNKLVRNKAFERYIVLSNRTGIGQVVGIYDENRQPLII
nr:stage III sporulation protein AA [Natranaerovirga pectinivora]